MAQKRMRREKNQIITEIFSTIIKIKESKQKTKMNRKKVVCIVDR